MKSWWILLAVAVMATGMSAHAVTAEMSAKESLRMKLKKLNKKHELNTDITDAEMAAQAGSRSQYSLKFNLSYYGAPIDRPFSKEGPNPDNAPIDPSTAFSGSLSMRYRLNKRSAISVGSGITALTPFHGVKRVDMKNPYASIDYNYRVNNYQLRSSISGSATTVDNYKKRGQDGSVSFSQGLAYRFPDTKFTLGSSATISTYIYRRKFEASDGSVSRIYLGVYPYADYKLGAKTSLKTSLGFGFYNPRSSSDEWEMQRRSVTQRLGVGYAHKRTVYIYPYVNFYPDAFNWKTTTVAFSTVFSLM